MYASFEAECAINVYTDNCCCFSPKCLFLSFGITFVSGKNLTSIFCQELGLVRGDEICVCLLLRPCKIDHVLNIFLSLPCGAPGK